MFHYFNSSLETLPKEGQKIIDRHIPKMSFVKQIYGKLFCFSKAVFFKIQNHPWNLSLKIKEIALYLIKFKLFRIFL